MIYFDSSYIIRLYHEDPGWEKVRELASRQTLACCLLGYGEVIAGFHRKLREGAYAPIPYRQVLEQFELDCQEKAFRWLPLSPNIATRLAGTFSSLPKTVFLRASDAIHLACAAENRLQEIYSTDQRLLAAANHFGLKGLNII
jgi:predicted nucleic acid-binding protein